MILIILYKKPTTIDSEPICFIVFEDTSFFMWLSITIIPAIAVNKIDNENAVLIDGSIYVTYEMYLINPYKAPTITAIKPNFPIVFADTSCFI